MIRAIIAALAMALIPMPAWAEDTPVPLLQGSALIDNWPVTLYSPNAGFVGPITSSPSNDGTVVTSKLCDILVRLLINKGSHIRGPLSLGVTDGVPVLVIEAGSRLDGPIDISVCDGRVFVSTPAD